MAIQFAHNTQAQLRHQKSECLYQRCTDSEGCKRKYPKEQDYLHHRSFWLRQINFSALSIALNDRVEGLKMNGEANLGENNILEAGSSKLSEVRRNIGLVPQRPCPLPMSIYDNVAYGCRIHGIHNRKKLDSIVEHYLKAVGLWEEVKK